MIFHFLNNFWFIQMLGVVALIVGVISWNVKKRKDILDLQSLNIILFTLQYILLGAYTGAIASVVTLARNLVFAQKGIKKWASSSLWIFVFIGLSILVLTFSWQGWPSILPVIGAIIGTYAVSRNDPKSIRFFMLLTVLFWGPYTLIVHFYSGFISQIITAGGLLIGIFRFDIKGVYQKTLDRS